MAVNMKKRHHIKQEFCTTRAQYREGRELKAVKVYTVNQESRYLLVQGIPAVGTHDDLLKMFALYGAIEEYRLLEEYPKDEFTEVMWIKFQKIAAARIAKRKMDNQSFYGGVLHVCYAPEFESIQDTREKLQDRRKTIAARIRRLEVEDGSKSKVGQPSTMASSEEWAYEPQQIREKHGSPHNSLWLSHNNKKENFDSLQQIPHGPSFHDSDRVGHLNAGQTQNIYLNSSQPQGEDHPQAQYPKQEVFSPNPYPYPPLPPPPQHQLPSAFSSSSVDRCKLSVLPSQVCDRWPESNEVHEGVKANKLNPPEDRQNKESNNHVGKDNSEDNAGQVIIKGYQKRTKSLFVPRQVQTFRKMTIKKHLLLKSLVPKEECTVENEAQAEQTYVKDTSVKGDGVNVALRMESFVLRGVQGPQLPEEDEEKRTAFKDSVTGSESVDQTVVAIRKRVQEFSAIAPPPQLKRKKKT